MPTYEYECKSCKHNFEVFQAMSDLPLKDCPECGREIRRLIFGGAGVIFKGSGFYITDKGNTGSLAPKKKAETPPCGTTSSCSRCPANTGTSQTAETPKVENKSA